MSTLPPAEPLQTPQLTQPAAVSTRGEKLAGIALVSALLYFILALIIFSFLLDYLIAWMYVGKSYPVLNRLIHITHEAPISYYLERAHLCFSRLSLIVIGAHLGLAAFFARASMRRIIISFFTTPSSPTNLAIFRIAVFVAVLLDLDLDAPAIVWFSSLPQQLQVPPLAWLGSCLTSRSRDRWPPLQSPCSLLLVLAGLSDFLPVPLLYSPCVWPCMHLASHSSTAK